MTATGQVLHVGIRGRGRAAGTPGRPPMVLLHAFPLDSRMWGPLAAILADRGVTAHAFDYPGFGTTPLWPGAEPTVDAIADAAVATLRNGIGAREATWVGCSMGGYVVLAIADRHPTAVSGVVMIDTRAGADDGEKQASRLAAAAEIEREEVFPDPRGQAESLVGLRGPRRDEVVAAATEIIAATPPEAAAWGQRAMAARPDRLSVLAPFEGRGSVVWGALDAVTSRADADAMASILGTETSVIEGAGHLSPLEAPLEVADAVTEFWSPHSG